MGAEEPADQSASLLQKYQHNSTTKLLKGLRKVSQGHNGALGCHREGGEPRGEEDICCGAQLLTLQDNMAPCMGALRRFSVTLEQRDCVV